MGDELTCTLPPDKDSAEWPGTQIGITNTITRTKTRTRNYNKTIDNTPGLYERLLTNARKHMSNNLYIHDAVTHGIKVRAYTNSPHLIDFWRENWFSVQEWRSVTGENLSEGPRVNVYAFCGVDEEEEAAYYSRKNNTVIFFNTAYYGQFKSWVLGAVSRILGDEYGIHSIHGAAVERNGKGVLYIAPTGTGKSTSSYGIMDFRGTRFHSDDWVHVRYCVKTRSGDYVLPMEVIGGVRGYQVFKWLEQNRSNKGDKIRVLSLNNDIYEIKPQEIDLEAPIKSFAFISEKVSYLRSDIVESFPGYTYGLLNSRLENVPDFSRTLYEKEKETTGELERIALDSRYGIHLRSLGSDKLQELLFRFYASEYSRAMLDTSKVFGRSRVFSNPLEPLEIDAVMLIKRNFDENTLLESLTLDTFCSRLMVGQTPHGKKEIAYNAYRAVDDDAEMDYVRQLGESDNVYSAHISNIQANPKCPETLYSEFEFFRIMHSSAKCYSLNTILQKSLSKCEAVLSTIKIIAKTIDNLPGKISLNLDDFDEYIRDVGV